MSSTDQPNPWVYDAVLWTLSIVIDLFFREVHPRSSWKVPKSGPVIFVAAPHANQFVDSLILMRTIRMESKRRISFLIAAKSLKRKFIGTVAQLSGSVGVGRAMDLTKPATGRIYLPDPDNDPTLVRGVGTNFESSDFQIGGLVVLPSVNNEAANSEISEIVGPEELRVKRPFKGEVALRQLTGREIKDENGEAVNGEVEKQIDKGRDHNGTSFKVAPKVDQTQVYDSVFQKLSAGGCIGIFPEGGSHDRTELLPLKAGVAIMALGAMAGNPDLNVKIIPCGMNYFNAHKFRSRAVIEFGTPIEVPPELAEEYKNGDRRHAIGQMLDNVYNALLAVTVTSPDYDTLMLIQAVRRLYNPKGKPLPLPVTVELNRRLVKGYNRYKDNPRVVKLRKSVMSYHKQLMALNVRDHQLEYAKLSIVRVIFTLFYRLAKLAILSTAVLPGLILFAPVFIAGKVISIRKAKEALAASSVKIQARDVVATWKLLVAMALAPALYTYYTVILTWWVYYNRVQGYVPEWVHLWAVIVFGYVFFPAITFAALRFGEIGMDIAKSLRPLVLSLYPSSGNSLVRLRKKRAELATEVTNVINELGPEMFPDFDAQRLVQAGEGTKTPDSPSQSRSWTDMFQLTSREESPSAERRDSETRDSLGKRASYSGYLPRNESFNNLSNIGLFASRPQTPTSQRSRTNSGSRSRPGSRGIFGIPSKGFTTVDSKEALDDVSKKIRGAMRERRQKRSSDAAVEDVEGEDEYESDASSGVSTPDEDALSMKKKE